jgi:hypothetical protein
MKLLNPSLIKKLDKSAARYGDDPFFAIRSEEEWFVFNWVLGLRFSHNQVMNCPHFTRLMDEADRIAHNEVKRDILRHVHSRSWLDIFVGTGIYQPAELVRLCDDEAHIFEQRGWNVIPFETHNGRRFYVREMYFDIAEEVIGEDIYPSIFRPINSRTYPKDYRPMVLQDSRGVIRGLLGLITEENLRNPIDKTREYRRYLETQVPELFD